jgi:hypothetical protein
MLVLTERTQSLLTYYLALSRDQVPMMYAIFVSPLFDLVPILSFVDDSYNVESSLNKNYVVKD